MVTFRRVFASASLLACVLIQGVPSAKAHATVSYDSWKLVLLQKAADDRGAVCLDGSAPGYYIERGSGAGVDKWMIHIQGGGWCTSLEACAGRAKTALGSSASFATDRDGILAGYDGGAHGLFSNDSDVNPDFYNWNKVYARYCDGASFAGDVELPVQVGSQTIYFRGRRVLDAVLDDLLDNQGLSRATDFLVNGCSAGGLSVWTHIDYISGRMPNRARVLGIPECGFFMDLKTAKGEPKWTPMYKFVAEMQNVTSPSGNLNQGCLAAYPGALAWKCFMAQYAAPFVQTPFFAVNSVYDAWQASNILAVEGDCIHDPSKCDTSDLAAMEELRTTIVGNLTAAVKDKDDSGFFTYNCATHCGEFAHDDRWNTLSDGQRTLRQAFTDWYAGRGASPRAVAAEGWGSKGNPTCNDN